MGKGIEGRMMTEKGIARRVRNGWEGNKSEKV